jgi:3-aminobutyryl-CoA ammonia-lyase
MESASLRVRMGLHDTHYEGGLIPAATILRLFADCSSELGIRMDGVDGYLAAYESAEFLLPVYAGDYIEITATLASKGNRSRRIALTATRAIRAQLLGGGLGGGTVISPPETVGRAVLVAVVPKQRELAPE